MTPQNNLFQTANPFIREGNRAPVAKATHARNWEGPVPPRDDVLEGKKMSAPPTFSNPLNHT